MEDRFLNWLTDLGGNVSSIGQFNPQDKMIIVSRLLFILAAFIWGLMYCFLGEKTSGVIPFSFSMFWVYWFIFILLSAIYFC